jgi:hypothetical protein
MQREPLIDAKIPGEAGEWAREDGGAETMACGMFVVHPDPVAGREGTRS